MELTYSDLPNGIRKIDLSGKLDMEGASKIDLRLTALISAEKTLVIVDLAGVSFLASIGIATLVQNARSARRRGGKIVLFNPQPGVAQVLAVTRIDQMIPICYDLGEAMARVQVPDV